MPHYISLIKWTSQGRMGLPAWRDRIEDGEREITEAGGRLVGVWVTLGRYDVVEVFEAPDDEIAPEIAQEAGAEPLRPHLGRALAQRGMPQPHDRARPVGVYRFWRDMGYALGALIAGVASDALGYGGAIGLVAGLTAASGLWVLGDMPTAQADERRVEFTQTPGDARPSRASR